MHGKGQPQSMSFPLVPHNLELTGKPKGIMVGCGQKVGAQLRKIDQFLEGLLRSPSS